jgi:hypothetical protein
VHAEALATSGTMAADLFFRRWGLEVLPDRLLRYIPRLIGTYKRSYSMKLSTT